MATLILRGRLGAESILGLFQTRGFPLPHSQLIKRSQAGGLAKESETNLEQFFDLGNRTFVLKEHDDVVFHLNHCVVMRH